MGIVGGVVSGFQLAVQNYPDIDLRSVRVTVRAPGFSAQEVEQDINRRVEESVIGLAGVERVVAKASEDLGRVDVEVATFADSGTVLRDVQNAVDGIENFPPLNAERPEVKLNQLDIEVMTLAVSSSLVGEDELRRAAEEVRSELLELPSISQVRLLGTRDREISIELSEEELRRNDLSIAQVANTVQRVSLNLTFGELRTESGGVVLHTVGKRTIGEEFESIPLLTRLDGSIVTLERWRESATPSWMRMWSLESTAHPRCWFALKPRNCSRWSRWLTTSNAGSRPTTRTRGGSQRLERPGGAGPRQAVGDSAERGDWHGAGPRAARARVRPSGRGLDNAGHPFSFIASLVFFEPANLTFEPGDDDRHLPDGRPRRGRCPGRRGEHRRGTRKRQGRTGGGGGRRQGGGKSDHDRGLHHDPRVLPFLFVTAAGYQ